MCFIEAAQAGMQMAGAMVQAYGQYQASRNQERILRQNEKLAKQQADDSINRGGIEAAYKGREYVQIIGKQRTAFAGKNIDPTSGSAAKVQVDTAEISMLDQMIIQNNAMREAWGYKVEAVNIRNQREAVAHQRRVSLATTLISGGQQAAGTFASGLQAYRARGKTFI